MSVKLNQEQNKQFWDGRAEQASGHQVSWWDINMKKIEIETLAGLISPDDYVLDVGCSNGAATLELYNKTKARFMGIDYSKGAIEQAEKIKNPNLQFRFQDVLTLNENNIYDKAISIRCLINLMKYSDQLQAIKNVHRALKPGGLFLIAEAFSEAFDNLNRVRVSVGLKPLPMPQYNSYLNEKKIETDLKDLFLIEKVIKHSSLYYIGTRVFQYLSLDEDPKGSDTEVHRFFGKFNFETKNSGDFGPHKVFVCRKK